MEDVILEMKGISKEFPGVKALDQVDLTLKKHSVHALMGENGAGKSTLMKCLFGIYSKDSGEIVFDNHTTNFTSPKQALENGVAMVHQELNQVLKRNVMDNIWLGRFPRTKLGFVDEKKMYTDTKAIFDNLGLEVNPRQILGELSVSQRQMVEIAKAVSYNAKVVVFDEPTSSLADAEVEQLFKIINRLRSDGVGIIYISHKMEEILRISDYVTIMRDGCWVSTTLANELTTDLIISQMVGRSLDNQFPLKDNVPGGVILEVANLTAEYVKLEDVSFTLKEGEILGLAGLMGAGRTELLETVFGIATKRSGTVKLHGQPIDNKNSQIAIRNKFALLTEERRATGIFGILSVRDNICISNLHSYHNKRSRVLLSDKMMDEDTDMTIESLRIKTPSAQTRIQSLSGGNQQKAVLGRWLLTTPEVLLLDEPTRGIDVGAKYEIYQLMIDLAKKGKAIVMCSSEMPELLGVCDRILVMSNGRLAGELSIEEATQEKIMTLATKYV